MSLSFVNAAGAADAATSTSHPITVPTGVQAGDLLAVCVGKGTNGGDFNTLAGWTQLLATTNSTVAEASLYWTVATSSEDAGDTVTFTTTTSTPCSIALLAFRGVDASPYVGSVAAAEGVGSTSHPIDASSVSPAGDAVGIYFSVVKVGSSGNNNTPPAGYTEGIDQDRGAGSVSIEGAYELVGAGSLGTLTGSSSFSGRAINYAIAFNALASSGDVPPRRQPHRGLVMRGTRRSR